MSDGYDPQGEYGRPKLFAYSSDQGTPVFQRIRSLDLDPMGVDPQFRCGFQINAVLFQVVLAFWIIPLQFHTRNVINLFKFATEKYRGA
jgi:hypothetical protein